MMIKTEPHPLATDGLNDEWLLNMNPLTVWYFDAAKPKVFSQLLSMCVTNKSDAKAVLSTIDEVSSNVGVKLH